MDSENPYPKSKPPLKWLKVPVSTDLHTKLRDKATELELTIPEAVELSIIRWIQE